MLVDNAKTNNYEVCMNKKVCPTCGLCISVQNYSRHVKRCDGSGLKVYVKQKEPNSLNCPYCNKLCKNLNSYRQHTYRCKENPNRADYNNFVNYIQTERRGKTAETCSGIAKQVISLKKKYEDGFVNPLKGKKVVFDYLYKDHNDLEIKKWLDWLRDNKTEINYLPVHHYLEGYEFVEVENKTNNCNYYISQQESVIRQLLKDSYKKCTIHHINSIRNDNRVENSLLFKDSNNHKRYHNSKYAYLYYDEETHLFSCDMKK